MPSLPAPGAADLAGIPAMEHSLAVAARLQHSHLYLGGSGVTKQQLFWLLVKLSTLRLLSLASLGFTLAVSALAAPALPALTSLDLSGVAGIADPAVRALVARVNQRSGLRSLSLASTKVTDVSLATSPSSCRASSAWCWPPAPG